VAKAISGMYKWDELEERNIEELTAKWRVPVTSLERKSDVLSQTEI